jgi:hypothetical protein
MKGKRRGGHLFNWAFLCDFFGALYLSRAGQGGGQRESHNAPKGQWTEMDCVYRHDLDRSHAINDKTKKQKITLAFLVSSDIRSSPTCMLPRSRRPLYRLTGAAPRVIYQPKKLRTRPVLHRL